MAYSVFKGPIELPQPLMVEGDAASLLVPGEIVFKSGNTLVIGDAATEGQLLITKENGPGLGGRIETPFAVGQPALAYVARQGLVFAFRCATGQALVAGETLLERGASGLLIKKTSGIAVAVSKVTVTTVGIGELIEAEVL